MNSGCGEPHDPGEREEQQDAHAHRAAEPERAPALLLFFRQLADEDRDEDDVVYAENDFEKRQGEKRDQPVGCEKGIHGAERYQIHLLTRSPSRRPTRGWRRRA